MAQAGDIRAAGSYRARYTHGTPKAAVKDAYKSSPITEEQYSDRNSINLLSPDKQYGIAFDVTSGTVRQMRAGTIQNFITDEPCI